jgi:hypothetical protein
MDSRKITPLLFIGLLSTSIYGTMEVVTPQESTIDITTPHKLSFKEKAAQVKATIATFMRTHQKTLI